MTEARVKRRAGSLAGDGSWLVLTESTHQEGVGYAHKCGVEIRGKSVAFTVRDGIFALSGSGKVRTAQVPYCPNCEQEPPSRGIITPEGTVVVSRF